MFMMLSMIRCVLCVAHHKALAICFIVFLSNTIATMTANGDDDDDYDGVDGDTMMTMMMQLISIMMLLMSQWFMITIKKSCIIHNMPNVCCSMCI